MRLYIIRHADPDYELDTITSRGEAEAKALAIRMHKEGIDKLFTSPMGRAVDTMSYTAKVLKKEGKVLNWAREHSDFGAPLEEGKYIFAVNLNGDIIRDDFSYLNHDTWHEMPALANPNIKKTYDEVVEGSDKFLASLGYVREEGKYRCIKPNEDKVAVFCHGGLGLTWLSHLLGIPAPLMWSGFWLSPTSVSTVLFDQRNDTWAVPRCLYLGDTSHIYESGMQVLPRGIVTNYY